MIEKFKSLSRIVRFYVLSIIGLVFQSAESIADLAGAPPLISLILSLLALVAFLCALITLCRKEKA